MQNAASENRDAALLYGVYSIIRKGLELHQLGFFISQRRVHFLDGGVSQFLNVVLRAAIFIFANLFIFQQRFRPRSDAIIAFSTAGPMERSNTLIFSVRESSTVTLAS